MKQTAPSKFLPPLVQANIPTTVLTVSHMVVLGEAVPQPSRGWESSASLMLFKKQDKSDAF